MCGRRRSQDEVENCYGVTEVMGSGRRRDEAVRWRETEREREIADMGGSFFFWLIAITYPEFFQKGLIFNLLP